MQWQGARSWLGPLLVGLMALGASIPGLPNEFVRDDIPVIRDNPIAHAPGDLATIFTEPYWPEGFKRDLYRPLSTWSFGSQWAVGDGSPRVFRAASYTLYALVSVGVLVLARCLVPAGIALAVAVLFAVHPVHVEAVAEAVNQSELWVALISIVLIVGYLRIREQGRPTVKEWMALSGFYLLACLFKEHALVIPGLLLAAEVFLVRGALVRHRIGETWAGYAGLALIGVVFMAVRTLVLKDLAGTFTAEALVDQGIWGRTLTMLQVVPEWIRLLIWPARLIPDYSPGVILAAESWGATQSLAVGIILAILFLGWLLRQSAPTVPFGIAWFALSIFPVSNILIPTGIVMAERTLFLPSIGAILVVGGLASYFLQAAPSGSVRVRRGVLVAAMIILVPLGLLRSGLRHLDYRNQGTFWQSAVQDGPLSYRTQHAYGELQWAIGDKRGAIRSFNLAIAMHPPAWWIRNDLAFRFQSEGLCYPALDLYAESLRIFPGQAGARVARVACLLRLGRYAEASAEATEALKLGFTPEMVPAGDDFAVLRTTADSASRADAPPGSVAIPLRITVLRH